MTYTHTYIYIYMYSYSHTHNIYIYIYILYIYIYSGTYICNYVYMIVFISRMPGLPFSCNVSFCCSAAAVSAYGIVPLSTSSMRRSDPACMNQKRTNIKYIEATWSNQCNQITQNPWVKSGTRKERVKNRASLGIHDPSLRCFKLFLKLLDLFCCLSLAVQYRWEKNNQKKNRIA